MLKRATETRCFKEKREDGQNAYTGFISFQHFRGEKLYSDIVVRPEANGTETERVECYPPSPDAEENGREEGYYPDSSVVYIRILWKEFEPHRGEYNYKLIEELLYEARAHGQTLIFRLMAHSTRASDDVPEWLKELIPCPERPDGARVKDSPTDPLFLELFLEAVKKIGERFDSDETFDSIDISLPGAWGEGHKLELYPADTLERIVDVYTSSFKHTQLLAQAGRPDLISYGSRVSAIGWRGDGLGEPKHTFEIYPERISKISEVWKSAPVSFESYWWLGEWIRRGWDIDEIIEKTLEWHISSFNAKSIAFPPELKEKAEYWISRMGYHFVIDSFSTPRAVSPLDTAEFIIKINNVGVAPIYKDIPFCIRLSSPSASYVFKTDVKVRDWFPGKSESKTEILLPKDIKRGDYTVEVGIVREVTPRIYFATDAKRDGSYYAVGNLTVI